MMRQMSAEGLSMKSTFHQPIGNSMTNCICTRRSEKAARSLADTRLRIVCIDFHLLLKYMAKCTDN